MATAIVTLSARGASRLKHRPEHDAGNRGRGAGNRRPHEIAFSFRQIRRDIEAREAQGRAYDLRRDQKYCAESQRSQCR